MKNFLSLLLLFGCSVTVEAQIQRFDNNSNFNQIDENGNLTIKNRNKTDSLSGNHKEIPKGLKVWTIDNRFGDQTIAEVDTVPHMFQNSVFTTGLRGEYNSTGTIASPRIARIYIDRMEDKQFIFTQPYDYFVQPVNLHHFTNTYSPITNITYNTNGNKINGEDYIKTMFAVNAGKRLGVGFKFDYRYARGYYSKQNASLFDYTMWGSYLGDKYQAHLLMSTNHQKTTENGGITNDNYITHPEIFNEDFQSDEIPTVLSSTWNRNDNQHIFFSHRYSVGFNKKVPMTEEEIKAKKFAIASKKENDEKKLKDELRKKAKADGRSFDEKAYDNQQSFSGRPENAKIAGDEPTSQSKNGKRITVNGKNAADSLINSTNKAKEDTAWLKNEYVPVTSFIHTAEFNNYRRIFQAYETPENYYLNEYFKSFDGKTFSGDSIYDRTRHFELKNTFAIAMLEGFNKWVKSGLKIFASYDMRHFELPDNAYSVNKTNEYDFSIGGQLNKTQGTLFHYNVIVEFGILGQDAGFLKIDANADLNFKLMGDTIQLKATGFMHRTSPTFYYRHYHSKHLWWDNDDLDKIIHSRILGEFSLKRTDTKLRIAYDNIQNYTYFVSTYNVTSDYKRTGNTVSVNQKKGNLSLLTAQLWQNFKLGILNWENVLTYQKSTDEEVLPVPYFNAYTNLYIKFRIAHVLNTEFGVDANYFTKYYAPDYCPAIGQFAVQGNGENQKVKVGNYPLANVYFNFHLKHTRFYVMYSHFNQGSFRNAYFYAPHYPLNQAILQFGLSWNFFN